MPDFLLGLAAMVIKTSTSHETVYIGDTRDFIKSVDLVIFTIFTLFNETLLSTIRFALSNAALIHPMCITATNAIIIANKAHILENLFMFCETYRIVLKHP